MNTTADILHLRTVPIPLQLATHQQVSLLSRMFLVTIAVFVSLEKQMAKIKFFDFLKSVLVLCCQAVLRYRNTNNVSHQ